MKKTFPLCTAFLAAALLFSSCTADGSSSKGRTDSSGGDSTSSVTSVSSLSEDASTWYLESDLAENYTTSKTVYIEFSGTTASITVDGESFTPDTQGVKVFTDSSLEEMTATLVTQENAAETAATDPDKTEAPGLIIDYNKGEELIRYELSGAFTGTFKLKSKKADAFVVLNNVSITSTAGGPALHFTSSGKRTFIIVPEETTNYLTDMREYTDASSETATSEIYNSKKGSVYAKGPVIFSGDAGDTNGGTIHLINTGYKHAFYSGDYIRIKDIRLWIETGENSRDCIRSLCAVIIDSGDIELTGNGTITDDESAGIRVDGEDSDDDEQTVSYAAGTGFIVINGGVIVTRTTGKGITAHWKSTESLIGTYTDDDTTSLLQSEDIFTQDSILSSASVPVPFVIINSGFIDIGTTMTPYENPDGSSCSPEGIESKGDLIINGGKINLYCTDDALNAAGAVTINGGYVWARSLYNDGIDSNDSVNGITINGGVVVASGTANAECGLDADNCKIKINGGWVAALGTENYTSGSTASQQYIMEIGSAYYSASSNFVITDSSGNPVFACKVPESAGKIMICSSPLLGTGTYTLYTGGTITEGDKGHFTYLYIKPAAYTPGTAAATVSVSSKVTTQSTTTNNGSMGDHTPGTRP